MDLVRFLKVEPQYETLLSVLQESKSFCAAYSIFILLVVHIQHLILLHIFQPE